MALIVAAAALTGWGIEQALSGIWGAALVILIATIGFAQRSLHKHVGDVAQALKDQGVAAGRASVSRIVGRDVAALDEGGVAHAAIESLAESFGDGVVAPAFWFLVGGLPGLFAYKAVNTADSMIGHLNERHRDFGWAAARLDDLLNLAPARIAGFLICVAGAAGARTMLRYAPRHASPNGGWPEAAMAGVLRLRLGGPVSYDGDPAMRAWLGDGTDPVGAPDIDRSLIVYRRACLLLWLGVGGAAWLA
jgi:adenosylcobinamide-phosphate synthase